MTHQLRPVPLSGARLVRALPLVQITWPATDSEMWAGYVTCLRKRTKGNGSGVIALRDNDDYFSGLIVYEVERALDADATLTIHLFTALDLANSAVPVRLMLEEATRRAVQLGCGGLQIRLHEEQAVLGNHLRDLGMVDRGGFLWKTLVTPNGRR